MLPLFYLLAAIAIIKLSEQPLLWFAGALLFIAGAVIWMMRSSYRRTDLIIFPNKRWLQPEWLYEAQTFIWLAAGLEIKLVQGYLKKGKVTRSCFRLKSGSAWLHTIRARLPFIWTLLLKLRNYL